MKYTIHLTPCKISHSLAVFHWNLSDSKSTQVSRTLLSILTDLNWSVVWMIKIFPLISNSSSHSSRPLGTVPSTPITIGITVTFMFHSLFSSLTRSKYLSVFSFSLIYTLWSAGTTKSTWWQVIFFSLSNTKSGLLVGIQWSVCISKF